MQQVYLPLLAFAIAVFTNRLCFSTAAANNDKDDNFISASELGLQELAKSARDPRLLAQALEDLKDPEIAAEVALLEQ